MQIRLFILSGLLRGVQWLEQELEKKVMEVERETDYK
jgi:hypothetical protein